MQAHPETVEHPFTHSQQAFAGLLHKLQGPETAELSHGAVEALLESEGRELLRIMYEDHLNLRAQAVPDEPVVGSDGQVRTHHRAMPRKLMSLFGPIVIQSRQGYRGRDAKALSPIDAELNLPPTIDSHGVQRRVGALASKCSFDEVGKELAKTTGATVGKRQLEQLVRDSSEDFDAFYAAKAAEPVDASATLLVGSVDATGIAMRPEALREATRRRQEAQAAEQANHGTRWPKPKQPSEMRRNGMRMAAVGAVYHIAPYVRSAQDILRDLRPVAAVPARPPRPRPQAKRVMASVYKSTAEVVHDVFDEMERRDPTHQKRWVLLLDGNEHQLACVEEQARRRGVVVTVVLDFIHVAQYVWGAAIAMFPEDEAARREWVVEKLQLVLWGEASTAAAAMRRSATKQQMTAKDRAPIDTCADYLLKYKRYLRYHLALRDGLPITTGVIEGACRYLVKDRMDITGARWGLATAEAVLRMRGLAASGDLDEYFDFHEALELRRNHLSHYANDAPPVLSRHPKPRLSVVS